MSMNIYFGDYEHQIIKTQTSTKLTERIMKAEPEERMDIFMSDYAFNMMQINIKEVRETEGFTFEETLVEVWQEIKRQENLILDYKNHYPDAKWWQM